jgi:hypothetical protein
MVYISNKLGSQRCIISATSQPLFLLQFMVVEDEHDASNTNS